MRFATPAEAYWRDKTEREERKRKGERREKRGRKQRNKTEREERREKREERRETRDERRERERETEQSKEARKQDRKEEEREKKGSWNVLSTSWVPFCTVLGAKANWRPEARRDTMHTWQGRTSGAERCGDERHRSLGRRFCCFRLGFC